MGDPLSIFTGALTVGDVCLRVGKYVKTVVQAAGEVNNELVSLQSEIDRFKDLYDALTRLCPAKEELQNKQHDSRDDPIYKLWDDSKDFVEEGIDLVDELEKVLYEIVGEHVLQQPVGEEQLVKRARLAVSQKFGDFRKAVKMLSKEKRLESIRQRMTRVNQQLSTMLTAINLYVPGHKWEMRADRSAERPILNAMSTSMILWRRFQERSLEVFRNWVFNSERTSMRYRRTTVL